jgi:hypothetical protein
VIGVRTGGGIILEGRPSPSRTSAAGGSDRTLRRVGDRAAVGVWNQ